MGISSEDDRRRKGNRNHKENALIGVFFIFLNKLVYLKKEDMSMTIKANSGFICEYKSVFQNTKTFKSYY
jgi:hypothetical protein